jgi:hypothetical protein
MIRKRLNPSALAYALRRALLFESGIIAAVSAGCWIIGWHDGEEIAFVFMAVAIIILAVGAYGMVGRTNAARNWEYHYVQTALRDESGERRAEFAKREMNEGFALLGQAALIGGMTLVAAVAADALL